MKSARRLVGVLCALSSLLPAAALAATEGSVRLNAAAQGQVVEAPGTDARAEIVTFGEDLASSLLQISPDQTVRIAGWPVAPGERSDVRLIRYEIYAPGARIWKVEGDRQTEVPRSRMAFFQGFAEADPDTRVFIAVEPDTGRLQGLAISHRGTYEIRPFGGGRDHLVTVPEYFLPDPKNGEAQPLSWRCGQSDAETPFDFLQEEPDRSNAEESPVKPLFGAVLSSLHTVTLAVDTDNELLLQKFSNNTTNATNYVAALIAAMNVIYERDLNIRLLQGSTNLRVSTTADPYSQASDPSGLVTSAQLSEFANYWATNYGDIQRGLAMMLSGKSPFNNLSAGRANLTSLCNSSIGYSFSQVYKFAGSTGATDAFVVGHELGHNFGSPHTHNPAGYNPPIDTCATTSNANLFDCVTQCGAQCPVRSSDGALACNTCPAETTINGVTTRGTLMSYCKNLSPFGSCTTQEVFHPRTIDLITSVITPLINNCVFPGITPPTISQLSPNNGTTAGGTAVIINGANFQNGATVTFGGSPVAATFLSSTQISFTTPAHATGTVGVTVTNPDTGSGTLASAFFYAPPPVETDFYTLSPCRVVDTRNPNGPQGGPQLGPFGERSFPVAGLCGVPTDALAVVVNLTVFAPTAQGNLSAYPGNAFYLGTSVLNFPSGANLANNAVLRLATNGAGTVIIRNGSAGNSHVILDVMGYFIEP